MKDFYFNENDAKYFISTHSYDEIQQEISKIQTESKEVLSSWSCLNNAENIVEHEMYNKMKIELANDPYFQTKCLLSNRYVELRKYIEFLEDNIKNEN